MNTAFQGFCYFHYWFNGKRLLERPFDEVLASGKPDFPFCLCWANETWSRRWLGEDKEILIQQTYSVEDFRNHARWLARAFADERYIRVNGRPVFVIYRYSGIPKEIPAIAILREELNKQGSDDPYLIAVDGHNPNLDYEGIGFDDRLAFEPNLGARVCRGWLDEVSADGEDWRALPGVTLEDKTCSLAFHYRRAPDRRRAQELLAERVQRLVPGPTTLDDKCVLNLVPPGAPDKGDALGALLVHSRCERALYVGDDVSDEAVFRLRSPLVLTVRVEHHPKSAADLYLKNQGEVPRLVQVLSRMLVRPARSRAAASRRSEAS